MLDPAQKKLLLELTAKAVAVQALAFATRR